MFRVDPKIRQQEIEAFPATENHTSGKELFEAKPCHFFREILIGHAGAFDRTLWRLYLTSTRLRTLGNPLRG
jgi:hypothetical protein